MKGTLLVFVAALAGAGCDSVMGVPCTLEARAAVQVTVRDAATAQPICDATVRATRQGNVFELRPFPDSGDCVYSGAHEVDGVFVVEAAKAGYQTATLRDVRVGRDECHVIPVRLTLDLRRSAG